MNTEKEIQSGGTHQPDGERIIIKKDQIFTQVPADRWVNGKLEHSFLTHKTVIIYQAPTDK